MPTPCCRLALLSEKKIIATDFCTKLVNMFAYLIQKLASNSFSMDHDSLLLVGCFLVQTSLIIFNYI